MVNRSVAKVIKVTANITKESQEITIIAKRPFICLAKSFHSEPDEFAVTPVKKHALYWWRFANKKYTDFPRSESSADSFQMSQFIPPLNNSSGIPLGQ